MTNQDKEKLLSILNGLATAFEADLTESYVKLVSAILSQYEIVEIERSAMKLIYTRKWKGMPTIAEILDGIHNESELDAQRAAYKVQKYLKAYNPYQSHNKNAPDDPITRSVMEFTGVTWDSLTRMRETDYTFWLREFTKLYNMLRKEANHKVLPMHYKLLT
jgi:hypothetical protein